MADTSGTVVGTQTSMRATKTQITAFTDYSATLGAILRGSLYAFNYKSRAYNDTRFVGIMSDESPEFAMDKGRSFNPVSAFGYTVAAFKAQQAQIEALTTRLETLEQRLAS